MSDSDKNNTGDNINNNPEQSNSHSVSDEGNTAEIRVSHDHTHSEHHAHHDHNHEPAAFNMEELDPGSQALAKALRMSFSVLKLVMICVIVLFLFSGVYKVKQNQQAVVLRFGRVLGSGTRAIKHSGLHWALPYIDEIIRVPAPTVVRTLMVDYLDRGHGIGFWYWQAEKFRDQPSSKDTSMPPMLQFVRDGYSLSASRPATQVWGQASYLHVKADKGSIHITDYNLVHSRWRIRYFVSDPVALLENLWDGTDVGWRSVQELLRSVLADSVVVTSAHSDIEQMVWGGAKVFQDDVQSRMAKRLKELHVGLTATLDLLEIKPPRQVKDAFDAAQSANIEAEKIKTDAQAKSSEIISAAHADANIIVAEAQAYQKTIVQAAKSDAEYLNEVLGKINLTARQKVPDTVANYKQKRQKVSKELLAVTVDQLYQEMLRNVIENADEVFVTPQSEGKTTQWRFLFSRDASLKPRQTNNNQQSTGNNQQ